MSDSVNETPSFFTNLTPINPRVTPVAFTSLDSTASKGRSNDLLAGCSTWCLSTEFVRRQRLCHPYSRLISYPYTFCLSILSLSVTFEVYAHEHVWTAFYNKIYLSTTNLQKYYITIIIFNNLHKSLYIYSDVKCNMTWISTERQSIALDSRISKTTPKLVKRKYHRSCLLLSVRSLYSAWIVSRNNLHPTKLLCSCYPCSFFSTEMEIHEKY